MNIPHTLLLADSWGMHGDVGAGWMILMMVLMILFWGAIVLGIVWLIRGATRGSWRAAPQTHVARESPVEILERRFAEGAISPEDYKARREVLVNSNGEMSGRSETSATTTPGVS